MSNKLDRIESALKKEGYNIQDIEKQGIIISCFSFEDFLWIVCAILKTEILNSLYQLKIVPLELFLANRLFNLIDELIHELMRLDQKTYSVTSNYTFIEHY